jgi:hypothetical protein
MSMSERDRLRMLAGYGAVLRDPGFTVGRWVVSEPDANGVVQMPWFEYSEAAQAFHSLAGTAGWIQPFDWMAWAGSPEGRRLISDPGLVAQASAEDLQRLITAMIRGDRFSEGELAAAFESGMVAAIVRRAAELAEAG